MLSVSFKTLAMIDFANPMPCRRSILLLGSILLQRPQEMDLEDCIIPGPFVYQFLLSFSLARWIPAADNTLSAILQRGDAVSTTVR